MGLYSPINGAKSPMFMDLAKGYIVTMIITSWQISHINCLKTL